MTVLRQYPAKSTPSCNRNHQYIVDLACMPRLTQDIYRQVLFRCCTVAHIHRRIPATYSKLGSCGTGNVSRNRRKVSSPSGMCSSDSPPVRVCISSPPVMTIKASLSAMHDSFVCCCIRAECTVSIDTQHSWQVYLFGEPWQLQQNCKQQQCHLN